MRIEYHPLTVSELKNAVVYYNHQRAGLGDELRTEVYAAIVTDESKRVREEG